MATRAAAVARRPRSVELPDDVLLITLTHLATRDLGAAACVSKSMSALVAAEQGQRRQQEKERRQTEKLRARERYLSFEGDERVLKTAICHMMRHAPAEYSVAVEKGRKRIAQPASGVCRLRVGICQQGITMDERRAEHMVDVLAMQEKALRTVEFMGEPLGAAGAAAVVQQAKIPRLAVPPNTHIYGRTFKVFIRADFVQAMDDPELLERLLSTVP